MANSVSCVKTGKVENKSIFKIYTTNITTKNALLQIYYNNKNRGLDTSTEFKC